MEPARLSRSKIEQRELEQRREIAKEGLGAFRWDMSRRPASQANSSSSSSSSSRGNKAQRLGGNNYDKIGRQEEQSNSDRFDGSHLNSLAKTTDGQRMPAREDKRRESKQIKLDDRNPCWFCLATPDVEKHLIIAIGEHCYLTLAKGGLTEEHFLLIPIDHIRALNDGNANSNELLEELELFKQSIVRYFGKKAQGVVFFERNFRSVHWQLQAVPIPLDTLDSVEEEIKLISGNHYKGSEYLDIPANCSLCDIIPPSVPYFYWQVEPTGARFVTQIQIKGTFFPIQLGRLVLADEKILNCPDKVDWKACAKTQQDYESLVKQIRDQYKEFDFT